jgi:hypothetical protein
VKISQEADNAVMPVEEFIGFCLKLMQEFMPKFKEKI